MCTHLERCSPWLQRRKEIHSGVVCSAQVPVWVRWLRPLLVCIDSYYVTFNIVKTSNAERACRVRVQSVSWHMLVKRN